MKPRGLYGAFCQNETAQETCSAIVKPAIFGLPALDVCSDHDARWPTTWAAA